jgi:hypothetical protein
MTVRSLQPKGRLGLNPRRHRSSPSFFPDHRAALVVWYRAGDPDNTLTGGGFEQAFDLSGKGPPGTATGHTAHPLDTNDADGPAIMRLGWALRPYGRGQGRLRRQLRDWCCGRSRRPLRCRSLQLRRIDMETVGIGTALAASNQLS